MASPTPVAHPPPPPLPDLAHVDFALVNYLRSFALWVQRGLSNKLTFSTAAPGLLLQAYDAPKGTTPPVFLLRVDSAGALSTTEIAISSPEVL
jgi:hypothetical protein